MGKKIDRFVLTLACAGAFYLYYQRAFHSRPIAIGLALLSCLVCARLLNRVFALASKGRFWQRRRIRKCAGSALMHIACQPREAAIEAMERLLRSCYDGEYTVELIQAHPSASLSQNQIFETWKAHRDAQRLAICITCTVSPECRMLAASLNTPKVALIDAPLLTRLITEHPEGMALSEEKRACPRRSLRRIAALLVRRKNAPRSLLFSGAMLTMYVLSANIFYLIFAMLLLFLALVSLKTPARPARLF